MLGRYLDNSFAGRKFDKVNSISWKEKYAKSETDPQQFLIASLTEVNRRLVEMLTTGVDCVLEYKDTEYASIQGSLKRTSLEEVFGYVKNRFSLDHVDNRDPNQDKVSFDVYKGKKDARVYLDIRRTRQTGHYFEITAMFKTTNLKRRS